MSEPQTCFLPWHVQVTWWLSITPSKQKNPPLTAECTAPDKVLSKGTVLIWTSHHTDIPLSWIMEKQCEIFCVLLLACDSNTTEEKLRRCGRVFLEPGKTLPAAGKGHRVTFQMVRRLLWRLHWLCVRQKKTPKWSTLFNTAKGSTASQWHVWATVLNVLVWGQYYLFDSTEENSWTRHKTNYFLPM